MGPLCISWWFLYLVLHQKHLGRFCNYRFLGPESEFTERYIYNKFLDDLYLVSTTKQTYAFDPVLAHSALIPQGSCVGEIHIRKATSFDANFRLV